MRCCQVTPERREGTNRFFSWFAKAYARSFRRKGLETIQEHLLHGVRRALRGPARRRILDVGCGVGALHLTLLREGEGSALGVDLSEGMLRRAADLAREMGLDGRTEYRQGDFIELAPSIGTADVTLMDKVVCCYEDVEALVEAVTDRTGLVLGLTHPRDIPVLRFAWRLQARIGRLLRFRFFPCWHEWSEVGALVEANGFSETFRERTFFWEAVVYVREPEAA